MLAELRQQQELQMEQQAAMQSLGATGNAVGSVWGGVATRQLSWSQPSGAKTTTEPTHSVWGHTSDSAKQPMGFWDDHPPLPHTATTTRQTNKKENKTPQGKQRSQAGRTKNNATAQSQPAKTASQKEALAVKKLFVSASSPDGTDDNSSGGDTSLTKWMAGRMRAMKADIDADFFASYLIGVEAPEDVEDYAVTYFGDLPATKEFVREFLKLRSERKAKQAAGRSRDDLSSAKKSTSAVSGGVSSEPQAFQPVKKKKKAAKSGTTGGGGGSRSVTHLLGFTATGDPNRLNAGDIDYGT